MNRRDALSAVGVAGLTTAFGIGRAEAEPVAGDAPPPIVTIADAITIAEAHLKAEKVGTAGHSLSSARLVREKGKLRWELRWDGTDRLAKGDWFVVRVGMDKAAESDYGLWAGIDALKVVRKRRSGGNARRKAV